MDAISNLSKMPTLLSLMSVCTIDDAELEKLFKEIRASILLSYSESVKTPQISKFQSALALQCFNNEYLYTPSDNEIAALKVVEKSIVESLSIGKQPSSYSILCVASYKALKSYEWCNSLELTKEVEQVVTRQVFHAREESQLKTCIPTLKEINNTISVKVRVSMKKILTLGGLI